MYKIHALTNEMVPDTNSLSINKLLKVATSQNNVEYCSSSETQEQDYWV